MDPPVFIGLDGTDCGRFKTVSSALLRAGRPSPVSPPAARPTMLFSYGCYILVLVFFVGVTCPFLLCDNIHSVFVVRLINWNFFFDLVSFDYFCLYFALWVTLKSIHPLVFSFVTLKLSTLYLFQHLNKMFIRAVFVYVDIFSSQSDDWAGILACFIFFFFLFIATYP